MSEHIAGKSIIVTGAGSGFGKLVSDRLAARGAKLACADLNLEAAQAVVAGIAASGSDARAFRSDVARIDDMRALARSTVEAFETNPVVTGVLDAAGEGVASYFAAIKRDEFFAYHSSVSPWEIDYYLTAF